MSQSDDEALTFIRALLGSEPRPDGPGPPDVDPAPETEPSDTEHVRALFTTKENQ